MSETVRVTFLFAIGQDVRWAQAPRLAWRVVWRRWHEGEFSRWVEYGIVDTALGDQARGGLAYEADLTPLEDHA